jgi:hypothetical protein
MDLVPFGHSRLFVAELFGFLGHSLSFFPTSVLLPPAVGGLLAMALPPPDSMAPGEEEGLLADCAEGGGGGGGGGGEGTNGKTSSRHLSKWVMLVSVWIAWSISTIGSSLNVPPQPMLRDKSFPVPKNK